VLTGPQVILTLKIAVLAVTFLFLCSLIALARGNYRWHGRINLTFFVLTGIALLGLEVVARLIDPELFNYFNEGQRRALSIHLCFSMPAALIMPAMLFTGLSGRRRLHLALAAVFAVLWTGTFVTGLFLL
jgi:uncharacterized membrane protein YozB (DUF420 family)